MLIERAGCEGMEVGARVGVRQNCNAYFVAGDSGYREADAVDGD